MGINYKPTHNWAPPSRKSGDIPMMSHWCPFFFLEGPWKDGDITFMKVPKVETKIQK